MSLCHAPPSWGAPIDMRLGSPTWWILAAMGAGDLLLATNPDGPVDSFPSRRNTYSLVVDQTWHRSQLECGSGIRAKRVDLRTSSRVRTSTPEVAQMLQVVAALCSVPPVTARTEFVRDLRERLITGMLERAGSPLSAATAHSDQLNHKIAPRGDVFPADLRRTSRIEP